MQLKLAICQKTLTTTIKHTLKVQPSVDAIRKWVNPHIRVFPTCFIEFSDKKIVIILKVLEPATSCVRDQDVTTAPARHMWEIGTLKWVPFMLQWFIWFREFAEFTEFPFYLGKSPLSHFFGSAMQLKITNCASRGDMVPAPVKYAKKKLSARPSYRFHFSVFQVHVEICRLDV